MWFTSSDINYISLIHSTYICNMSHSLTNYSISIHTFLMHNTFQIYRSISYFCINRSICTVYRIHYLTILYFPFSAELFFLRTFFYERTYYYFLNVIKILNITGNGNLNVYFIFLNKKSLYYMFIHKTSCLALLWISTTRWTYN